MATKKIKIGVAGLGRIGWDYHCKEIHQNKKYELVAVLDLSQERRLEAETTYGCKAYADYQEFLQHKDLEVVVIALPTHLHKETTIQALKAKKHVLLEKPMAASYQEAKAMLGAAKKQNRLLTIYQPARLSAFFQQLKKILESQIIGTAYHIQITRNAFKRRNDWQSLQKYNGGMLFNYGSHVLDQLLNLIGHQFKKTTCVLRRVATLGDADDVVKVLIQTKNGILGEADINSATLTNPDYMRIYGTTGTITIPKNCNELHITYFKKKELSAKKLEATLLMKDRSYGSDQFPIYEKTVAVDQRYKINIYANLFEAIRHHKPLLIQPQEVAEVIKLIEKCKKENGKILDTRI